MKTKEQNKTKISKIKKKRQKLLRLAIGSVVSLNHQTDAFLEEKSVNWNYNQNSFEKSAKTILKNK